MSRPVAVQFGAGNIGRGFTAQLLYESGFDVVFVDVAQDVVAALNERGAYEIQIVGAEPSTATISGVRAIDGRDVARVAAEIAASAIVCTAVGAGALRHIAPALAEGLALRNREGGGPLNIIICENLHNAAAVLRDLVAEHLPAVERGSVLDGAGFVQAVVSRMVPLREPNFADPLSIRAESYKRLPVDAAAIVGALPPIAGLEPVKNFAAHEERKLYTHNCAHAALGYLGWIKGLNLACDALTDPDIRQTVDAALEETGAALISRWGFEPSEHAAHAADLMERFANGALGDTCFRLARDPIRKLAPGDRLVGAARLCEAEDITPAAVANVIGAAFRFVTPEDSPSMELRTSITRAGFGNTMEKYCGIRPAEPLGGMVHSAYERWAGR